MASTLKMSAVGFDVGNENCVIAGVKEEVYEVFLNEESKRETPTVVCFGQKQRFIGASGAANASMYSKSTIAEIKWLIGRNYNEIDGHDIRKILPFEIIKGSDEGVLIRLNYLSMTYDFTPVEIIAMVFKHLKEIAEKNLGIPVVDCVIGIPSYFSDLQRRAYLNATEIAGLNPLRLMHDCTATALSYGIYKSDFANRRESIVVFVDIGQCDMQVSIVSFFLDGMKIRSHAFDSCLGGRDFDLVLMRHFAHQFNLKYNCEVYSNVKACMRLRAACEKLKKVLSANSEAPINVECLMADNDLKGFIKREEFETLSKELFERIKIPCQQALDMARISSLRDIESIELVGSGSRIPYISKLLADVFGKEPSRTLNSSECIARGCAIQCAMLSPRFEVRDYKVQDLFPFSVGILCNQGPETIPLGTIGKPFPRRTVLRCHLNGTCDFKTLYINSNTPPLVTGSNIGSYGVSPFEWADRKKVLIKISIVTDIHGIIRVENAMLNNGDSGRLSLHVTEEIDGEMTRDYLLKAQENERYFTELDKDVERANNIRNDLESYVYDIRNKLSDEYQSFATDTEGKEICDFLDQTADWLYGDGEDANAEAYSTKLDYLRKMVHPIEIRFNEDKGRAQACKELKESIHYVRAFAMAMGAEGQGQMLHECDRAESWLTQNIQRQQSLRKNADPVILVERIRAITQDLIKYKEDTERAHATNELMEHIGCMRASAELMSAEDKHQMLKECDQVEIWLRQLTEQKYSLHHDMDPMLLREQINNATQYLIKCKEDKGRARSQFETSEDRQQLPENYDRAEKRLAENTEQQRCLPKNVDPGTSAGHQSSGGEIGE